MEHSVRPYTELEYFNGPDLMVFNEYHGGLCKDFDRHHTPWTIYTCFGEVLPESQIFKIVDRSSSFIIIPTTRRYPDIDHKTDRYEIISVPSAYAWYSTALEEPNFQISDKKITKKILSLNNRGQWPRQALFQFLTNFNLLDQCYFSYHCLDINGIGRLALFHQTNDIIGETWFNSAIDVASLGESIPFVIDNDNTFNERRTSCKGWSFGNEKYYLDSFCSVITETYIDENWDPFFTEKIFKPLAYGHPFLVHSSAGALRLLRQMGFETFPELFDESYDDIESPQMRFEHILRQIQRICDQSLDDLQNLYQRLIPKLRHNQHVFRALLPSQYSKDIQLVQNRIAQIINVA